MIISRVIGGLGNQMFQYACGRALAVKHSTRLALDVSVFENYALHNGYELAGIFNIAARTADESDCVRVLGLRGRRRIRTALIRKRYSWLRGRKIFVEPHYHFCDGVADLPSDSYLAGYWQSEKYFEAIQDVIREDFSFTGKVSPENGRLIDRIRASDSISVHIRRGDYVKNEKAAAVYAACGYEYYSRAIEAVASRCSKPSLFVFSDDIAWVQEHLRHDLPCEFVMHNVGRDSHNDMRLMAECSHNIIANSTFSWWGAWLNLRRDKIVVAPKKWFSTSKFDSRDLIPSGWIRL